MWKKQLDDALRQLSQSQGKLEKIDKLLSLIFQYVPEFSFVFDSFTLAWRSSSTYQNENNIGYFESTQGDDLTGYTFVGNIKTDGRLIEDNIEAPNMQEFRNPQSQDESISIVNSSSE